MFPRRISFPKRLLYGDDSFKFGIITAFPGKNIKGINVDILFGQHNHSLIATMMIDDEINKQRLDDLVLHTPLYVILLVCTT